MRAVAVNERSKGERTFFRFVLPALALNVLVVSGPSLGTLMLSFTNWTGVGSFQFVGFSNYFKLAVDPIFWAALLNNIKWLIIFCTIPIAIGLGVALLVNSVKRGQIWYRALLFIPYLLSTVLVSQIWDWIYNPFSGINTVLQSWGIVNPPGWLADPNLTLYSVAIANVWQWWPFLMVLFLTALTQVDTALHEAAMVEGASRWQRFWHVTLPQIRPTLILILMLTMIWSFAVFDYVYIMTSGGPGYASTVLATYMFQELVNNQQAGYASAIAGVMVLLSFFVIGAVGLLQRRGWDI